MKKNEKMKKEKENGEKEAMRRVVAFGVLGEFLFFNSLFLFLVWRRGGGRSWRFRDGRHDLRKKHRLVSVKWMTELPWSTAGGFLTLGCIAGAAMDDVWWKTLSAFA